METVLPGIIIVGVATFNVTTNLRHLPGPFNIFGKLRLLVGIEQLPVLDGSGKQIDVMEDIITPDRFVTKLFVCFWCLSTWVAAIFTVIYGLTLGLYWEWWFFIWMGASGLAGYMNERVQNGQSH